MKIATATLERMRAAIEPLDTITARQAYRNSAFPRADRVKDLDKRYRWDLLWAAKAHPGYDNGLTDVHVDTAPRRIVPPLGQ